MRMGTWRECLGRIQLNSPCSSKASTTVAKQKVWKLVEDEIAGIPILVYHDPENYASSVYRRTVGDSVLVFGEGVKGAMARDIGGSVWNLLTGAGSEGRSLVPVPHLNIYWYAWADFYPDAELYKH